MLTLRPSRERGYADHGWLQSYHSFSFAGYQDPAQMGVGNLRVINDDVIAPGKGFGTHAHRDMEILTYVLSGELAHRDSMGHVERIVAGEVQRMSAGTGVQHSEFNPSPSVPTHLLQIWVHPHTLGIAPSYAQKTFTDEEKRGTLCLLASPDGAADSLVWHADARLYAGLFDGDAHATLALAPGRATYVHVVRGQMQINGQTLKAGDAATLTPALATPTSAQSPADQALLLSGGQHAEVLVFDLSA